MPEKREVWKTRIGLILATAGSAIGLGNFLRFPVQCAQNGGGAFMIPYLVAFLLLGIPLMWVEWAMGRIGGRHGHGTTPRMFDRVWRHPLSKYLGTLGILLSIGVSIYYIYIESWTLGYSFFSLTGKYQGITSHEEMGLFLASYQGLKTSKYFSGLDTAYLFYLITLGSNIYILSQGVVKGLERLAKIAMPLLFIFGIILLIRTFALGTPDPNFPDRSILSGLGFMWNPDLSALKDTKVWLAAAGQIFFTLSVGLGTIHTYASYLRKKDDIALNGLAAAATNEFAEVIVGGSIAIPIAVAFFGISATTAIAAGGAFDLGFQALPIVFQNIPVGRLFGALWFLLLFFAGITSSVSLIQPTMAFFQEEFHLSRKQASWSIGILLFILGQLPIFFLKNGVLDEMDFWFGTFGLVLFGTLELIVFVWLFKPKNAWREITMGADIGIPKIFLWILKYVTPTYMIIMLLTWAHQHGWNTLLLKGVSEANRPYVIGTRILMVGIFIILCLAVRHRFKKMPTRREEWIP